MNPLSFALRHPVTVMVAVMAIALGSVITVFDVGLLKPMRRDVFPNLNQPVIYVAQPYGGMDPAQMEGLITNYYEYAFLFMNGIHHVESRERAEHRAGEALLPAWHEYGSGGRGGRHLCQPGQGVLPARNRHAFHHVAGRQHGAGRLRDLVQRFEERR